MNKPTLEISVTLTGSAFYDDNGQPNPGPELARILRQLADRAEGIDPEWGDSAPLYDVNGNKAGSFTLDGMEADEDA